jgi:hypothetical protein
MSTTHLAKGAKQKREREKRERKNGWGKAQANCWNRTKSQTLNARKQSRHCVGIFRIRSSNGQVQPGGHDLAVDQTQPIANVFASGNHFISNCLDMCNVGRAR